MEKRPNKWEIELQLPKGRIKTFVYSHDGKNIKDRFGNTFYKELVMDSGY